MPSVSRIVKESKDARYNQIFGQLDGYSPKSGFENHNFILTDKRKYDIYNSPR